ncbi:hypothetical protein Vretimale_11051, partial [Volvox reticuliferus]
NDGAVSSQEQLASPSLAGSVSPSGGNNSCRRPIRSAGEIGSHSPLVPDPAAVPWWQTLSSQPKASRSGGRAKSARSRGGSCKDTVESSSVEARGGGSGSCSNSGGDTARSSLECESQKNDAVSDVSQPRAESPPPPPPPKPIPQQGLLPVQQEAPSEHAVPEQLQDLPPPPLQQQQQL